MIKPVLGLVAAAIIGIGALVAFQRVETAPEETISTSIAEASVTPSEVSEETAVITIGEGDTADGIGEALEDEGVISSARLFRVLVTLMGIGDNLGLGEYEFNLNTPILTVIDQLQQGGRDTSTLKVVVPEGLRLEEIAAVMEENEVVTAKDFLAAAKKPGDYDFAFLEDLPKNATLEGYLFPATYDFPTDIEAPEVVETMLQAFDDNLTEGITSGAKAQKLTLHELITMASIVEREAVVARERPVIARVYLNRIENDMLFQADPTTQYAVANADPAKAAKDGWWKRDLTQDDLKLKSPYNTYVTLGIPPGPIAAPGLASLEAVAGPSDDNFLFFVACGDDGEHEFAATLADHEANVARCQAG